MVPKVSIGEVSTEVTVTDASSFLGRETLERIVQAVIARLDDREQQAASRDRERSMGRQD